MLLDQIPLDKSHHAIGGAIIGAAAALAVIHLHIPIKPWQASAGLALAAGIFKEILDAYTNRRVTGQWMGNPRGTPHGVEGYDALATALGGVLVALPLIQGNL